MGKRLIFIAMIWGGVAQAAVSPSPKGECKGPGFRENARVILIDAQAGDDLLANTAELVRRSPGFSVQEVFDSVWGEKGEAVPQDGLVIDFDPARSKDPKQVIAEIERAPGVTVGCVSDTTRR